MSSELTRFGRIDSGRNRARAVVVGVALGTLFAGCRERQAPDVVQAQGAALSGARQITLRFPVGSSLHTAGLLASGTLHIADGVTVQGAAAGTFAAVANTGSGLTDLGVSTRTGDVVSVGAVTLHDLSRVTGSVATAGTIAQGNGVVVTGTQRQHATLTPFTTLSWSVTLPAPTGAASLEPGQTRNLAPGSYTTADIKQNATLRLVAGTYAFDNLVLESGSTMSVDATGGPVFIYVGTNLTIRGAVNAGTLSDRVAFVYLGTAQASLEVPFSGTVVAPNAPLFMAPVASPGFTGSFFAAQIDVEAHDTVTLKPFAAWDVLFPPVPVVECVTRFDATHANALFGYTSPLDTPAAIPVGPRNLLAPSPTPPPQITTFLPGRHDNVFFASFSGASIAWTLSGRTVTANASTRACQLADYPSAPVGSQKNPAEGASKPGAGAFGGLLADNSAGLQFQSAPLPWGTSSLAPARAAANTGAPLFAAPTMQQPFDLVIDAQTFGDDEFCPGSSTQLSIRNIDIAGVPLPNRDLPGCTNGVVCGVPIPNEHFQVDIPVDQPEFQIHFQVFEIDSCSGDDHELDIEMNIHNDNGVLNGGFTTFIDGDSHQSLFLAPDQCTRNPDGSVRCFVAGDEGFGIGWTAHPSGKPRVCAQWNAQYIDAGFGEDFATDKGLQQVPASFALASFVVSRGGTSQTFTAPLDKDGCLPPDLSPGLADLVLSLPGEAPLTVKMLLASQFCLDPSGQACAGTGPSAPGGARFSITRNGFVGPATVCTTLTTDDTFQDPNCVVLHVADGAFSAWPGQWSRATPPSPLNFPGFAHADITRVAGVVSEILRREVDTNGGLGVQLALIQEAGANPTGVANAGEIDIVTNAICPDVNDTCASDPIRYRGQDGCQDSQPPENCRLGDDRWKMVVAHEIGHVIQRRSTGEWNASYTFGPNADPDPAGAPPLCRCDQVDIANRLHCLQSIERASTAQVEGFAQYFASKTWNDDAQSDCEFTYYKEFRATQCLAGVPAADCAPDAANPGLFINTPPLPVDCATPTRWRNTHCLSTPQPAGSVLPDMGSEYDWMGFYYQLTKPGPNSFSASSLSDLYRGTCANVSGFCNSDEVAWENCPTCTPVAKGLHAEMVRRQSTGSISLDFLQNFEGLGNLYGVSRDLTPGP